MFLRLTSITYYQRVLTKLGPSAVSNVRKIFYDIESRRVRLVGALMLEQNDEWAETHCDRTLETVREVCKHDDIDPVQPASYTTNGVIIVVRIVMNNFMAGGAART